MTTWIAWVCHAKPVALGGRTCGYKNTRLTMYQGLEVCSGCGATKKASDDRKAKEAAGERGQPCEECGRAMLLGPLGASDFVPLVCAICYAAGGVVRMDPALDADIQRTRKLQEAEACARGDLAPYDPTVGGCICAGCKRTFHKGINQHVSAARKRFAKLERKEAAVRGQEG